MNEFMSYETFEVEVGEVDYMGEYQLYRLFNRFSKIATSNAGKIGLWKEDMVDKYGWVVAKQTLHLKKPLSLYDTICLSTTIGNGRFASFPRFYFIEKDKEEIGYCASLWTLIDIESRRITAPRKIGLSIPEVNLDIPYPALKTIDVNSSLDFKGTRQVLYSDVDTNQHMNNTRYIQWAFDLIDFDIHRDYFVSDLSIQYKKEIRPLEIVYLFLGYSQNKYFIEGRNEAGESYFLLEIIFTKR